MNTAVSRKNIIFTLTSLLSLALLAVVFLPTTVQATSDDCTLSLSGDPADLFSKVEDGTLEFSHFAKSNGQAKIEITNNSDCKFPVALGAYKMSGNQLSDQTLSDEHQAVIPAHDSATLSVDLPSCMAEIDLFYDRPGDGIDGAPEVLSNSKSDFSVNLIGYTFHKNDQDVFAENDLFHFDNGNSLDEFPNDEDDSYQDAGPQENFCGFTPTLSGSCDATPSNPETGETVNWEASASGGTGDFTYSWSGAVSGSNQTETANYSSVGEKTATVTISSGDQQIERSCSINVKEKQDTTCDAHPADYLSVVSFDDTPDDNNKVSVTVENNSQNCSSQVNFSSYKLFESHGDDGWLETQELFDNQSKDLGPGEEKSFMIEVPSCAYQLDVYHGEVDTQPPHDTLIQNGPGKPWRIVENENHPLCGMDDEPEPDPLAGSCVVSPNEVEPGEEVLWSANASGGETPYSFSWNLEGSNDDAISRQITTSYNSEGTFDGTVTITDDQGESLMKTCSVRVEEDDNGGDNGDDDDNGDDEEFGQGGGGSPLPPRDDDDDGEVRGEQSEDFSVQCVPDRSSYLIGERVSLTAEIDGDVDEDDIDFSWSGSNRLNEDDEEATVQFLTSGTHTIEVEAELDGETESDTCRISVRRGSSAGVTLDQIPYTGPGDTAKTVGFIAGLITLALAGGTLILRRREEGIPIGIPTDLS